jgi:hypothetical protein
MKQPFEDTEEIYQRNIITKFYYDAANHTGVLIPYYRLQKVAKGTSLKNKIISHIP